MVADLVELRETGKPLTSVGKVTSEMPAVARRSPVRTASVMKSARVPFVIQHLGAVDDVVVRRRACAVVWMAATSEPASGSLTPSAAIFSPAQGRRQELALLLVGADLVDDRRGHLALDQQGHVRRRRSRLRDQLLARTPSRTSSRRPLPPYSRGRGMPRKPQLAALREDLAREDARARPTRSACGRQLLLDESRTVLRKASCSAVNGLGMALGSLAATAGLIQESISGPCGPDKARPPGELVPRRPKAGPTSAGRHCGRQYPYPLGALGIRSQVRAGTCTQPAVPAVTSQYVAAEARGARAPGRSSACALATGTVT